jgi:histidinol-phosphatase (PHP family)
MIVDYHMHLRGGRQGDGREGPVEHSLEAIDRYVEVAAERGVDEIGFAEHAYYFREFASLVEHPYQRSRIGHDLDTYAGVIVEAREQGLPVKLGLEVDFYRGSESRLAEILSRHEWDYLLGSVHIVDGEEVDRDPGLWGKLSVHDVWRRYFEEVEALARSGLTDVLAHPDLPKIFGRRPAPDVVGELHERYAEAAADGGVAVEVSTAGLRKRVGELYPDAQLLAACAARNVPVTLASDAHIASDVGLDFESAVALLRRTGYETLTVFERRRARQEPLG